MTCDAVLISKSIAKGCPGIWSAWRLLSSLRQPWYPRIPPRKIGYSSALAFLQRHYDLLPTLPYKSGLFQQIDVVDRTMLEPAEQGYEQHCKTEIIIGLVSL